MFNLFRLGFFRAAHGWGAKSHSPLPKICHTYPTMMKRGTVMPYLKKIQKIFLLTSAFIQQKSVNFAISRCADID